MIGHGDCYISKEERHNSSGDNAVSVNRLRVDGRSNQGHTRQ